MVTDAGEELLDLVHDGVRIADPGLVIVAGELDEPGAGDMLGDVAALLHPDRPVAGPVQDESGHADQGQHVPGVDLPVHPEDRQDCAWAGARTLVASYPVTVRRVAGEARRIQLY